MSETHMILMKLEQILQTSASKEDLKEFATKEDLKEFATKEDLKEFATKEDLKEFATKEDLKEFATKEDLKGFATKEDIEMLEFVLRQEAQTIYNVAVENKSNICELMTYRDLFNARIKIVDDTVKRHEKEIKYLKKA